MDGSWWLAWMAAGVLGLGSVALAAVEVPLVVTELDGLSRRDEAVAAGVPLPKGAVGDADKLALIGADGQAVPADFTALARWADGSLKWVLCDWLVSVGAKESARFRLRDGGGGAKPATALYVDNDTNEVTVNTGVLAFLLNKHGFDGFAKAWLDLSRDGKVDFAEELIAGGREGGGLVAVGQDGKTVYASRWGRVSHVEVERQGPLHATICVKGDLRSPEGQVLLQYAMRFGVQAGSSVVRMVCTIQNPRPCGRINGDRWVLGQSGSVLFESLDFVIPVETRGLRRVTLSAEPGQMWDRLPDPPRVAVYQDSSGGQNWFGRVHVNRDNRIPLQFCGWRAWYGDTQIGQGARAEPWIDLSDMRWGVSAAVPKFWQAFPKSLAVEDGDIRIGLWPGEFADLHELQGGEQKTHEWTVYFHHRRGPRREAMPYEREVMPTVHHPLRAWAPSEWYFSTGVFDPHVPYDPQRFPKYEARVQAAVTGQPQNLFVHRERADEYGWRNYGDTWAQNERDRTGGPHDGLDVVSHYNNEYDHGYQMLIQCLRTVDAGEQLWPAWWELGRAALWHEADIDIYHSKEDLSAIYNGGKFTHTAHGVDAGRSTHRGSPRDELWGQLDWAWKRGSSPESGHFNTRGLVHLYLLSGDRHLLDAAWDLTDLVAMKVETGRFAQINQPTREAGNNLQILTDAYLLTWDEKYRELAEKVVEGCNYESVMERSQDRFDPDWSTALYLQALGRYIEILQAEKGVVYADGVKNLLSYTARMLERRFGRRGRGFGAGGWDYRFSDAMMLAYPLEADKDKQARYLEAARGAFEAMDDRVGPGSEPAFSNSKSSTILMGGGGRYMRHAVAPAEPKP